MRAELVTDIEGLAAIAPAWSDLVARVATATPFVTPAWLLPWWRAFAPGALFVVTVFARDRLVGLAPLYLEDGRFGPRLLPLGIGLSDMLDILLDPACAPEAGALIASVLRDGAPRQACWSAEEAAPEAAVLALAEPAGWRSSLAPQSACPHLALPAGGLRAAIPARQWRKWQMARNRAARRAWSIAPAVPDTLDQDLAQLFRLHGLRWTSRGESGVLSDARVRRFHAEAAPGLLAAGLLRLTLLRLDGEVAGACYCLQQGATTYAYLGGFDPAYGFESPGTLLIGEALEEASCRGARGFSFLRGQEAYKYAWGAVDRWNQRRLFEPVP